MSKKDVKILLLGVLLGVIFTLLMVRILDASNNELILEEDLISDQDFSFETESSESAQESTKSGVDQQDLQPF